MNTKLLAGISLAAMAGSFWACGEGPINSKEFSDTIVESLYGTPDELEALKEQAKTDCWQNDPSCAMLYESYVNPNASNPTPSSAAPILSSASGPVNPPPTVSSSSEEIQRARSSSSNLFHDVSSAEESSSSVAKPVTGLGSCYPEKTPIQKGESVSWKFKPNPNSGYVTQFQNAVLSWNFSAEGSPSVQENGGITSTAVTYANSGTVIAHVTVTMPDGTVDENKECDPLQVNGDPITCTCTAEGGDVTADAGVATWTAKCTSKSAINNYSWDGVDGESTTFTHTFAKKGETYTPTLKVSNIDKTVETVPCMEIKATDTSVPEAYSCSVDKTEIELGQSFTFSVELSSGLNGHNCSIQGSGAPQNIQCSEASITVTPAEAGLQVYDYSLKGQKNNETVEESCSKKVSVVDNSATWESKSITLAYGGAGETLKSGFIYSVTYTGQSGTLVCSGSGSVVCGSSAPVVLGSGDAAMGKPAGCETVKVFGSASCKHTW